MNSIMQFTRAVVGYPATILWVLVLNKQIQSLFSLDELQLYLGCNDDNIREAVNILGPDGLGYCSISVRERGKKWLSLADGFQDLLPGFSLSIPDSKILESGTLSSSNSNNLLRDSLLIESTNTTTSKSDSEKSDSDFAPLPPKADNGIPPDSVDDVAQIRRILAATPILFGEPGVFTKGLHLESLRIDDVLGWLMEAMNADNLPLRSRAGVAYNGLKRGDRPAVGYRNVEHDKFPQDFLVEIGERKKQCVLCHEDFDSLAEHGAHWKICIDTPKPEPEEEPDCVLEPFGLDDDHPGQVAWGAVLSYLKNDMPRASFETWVKDARAVEWRKDERVLVIGARNTYACDWLTSRLSSTVNRLIGNRMDGECQVRFCVIPGGG